MLRWHVRTQHKPRWIIPTSWWGQVCPWDLVITTRRNLISSVNRRKSARKREQKSFHKRRLLAPRYRFSLQVKMRLEIPHKKYCIFFLGWAREKGWKGWDQPGVISSQLWEPISKGRWNNIRHSSIPWAFHHQKNPTRLYTSSQGNTRKSKVAKNVSWPLNPDDDIIQNLFKCSNMREIFLHTLRGFLFFVEDHATLLELTCDGKSLHHMWSWWWDICDKKRPHGWALSPEQALIFSSDMFCFNFPRPGSRSLPWCPPDFFLFILLFAFFCWSPRSSLP